MPEVRISPDQKSVAIRSVFPEESFNAYGVMNDANGGHWATKADVQDWPVLELPPPSDS